MSVSWKKNLTYLSMAQFLSMVGMSFFLPFIPLYLMKMGMTSSAEISTWSGILYSSGFLVASLAAPMWGAWADSYGRKIMVIRAMAAAAVILFITAYAQTPYQLLALRMTHGFFSGFVSSAVALVASEVPERSLGFGLGIFQSTLTAGFIVGPSIGGTLHDRFGIRPTIILGAALVLAGAAMVLIFVRENKKPKQGSPKFTIWENANFVFTNKTLFPVARIQFLSNMGLMIVAPIIALMVAMMIGVNHPKLGTITGFMFSGTAISIMIGAPLWGRVGDKIGQKKVLMFCLFCAGVTFIPQGLSQNPTHLFISRFLLGIFAAGIAPSLQALIAYHSPIERRAGILGISFSMMLMGNAVGPLIGGAMGSSIGLRAPFFAVFFVLMLAAYLSQFLKIKLIKAPASTLTQAD